MREPNLQQGTGAWFSARTGFLTASRMAQCLKRLRSGEDSAERRGLKVEILAERLTGNIVPKYTNEAMQWGIEQEAAAKEAYEAKTGKLIQDVGFIPHPRIDLFGASPDGLVDDGLIEIKCPTTSTHLQYIMAGVVPDQYKPQMMVQCLCTGRSWVDFVSYDPRMPEAQQLFIRRFTPSPEELASIESEAVAFLAEIDAMFEAIVNQEMTA